MRTFFVAAAAFLTLAPIAAAAQPESHSFTRDGDTYVFVTDTRADGAQVIRGRQVGGASFRLVVADGRVRGTAGGRPVSFRVGEAALPVQTAAN